MSKSYEAAILLRCDSKEGCKRLSEVTSERWASMLSRYRSYNKGNIHLIQSSIGIKAWDDYIFPDLRNITKAVSCNENLILLK